MTDTTKILTAGLTVDEIREEIARLRGELAKLADGYIEIWNGVDGDIEDCPPGGATLTVSLAVRGTADSYVRWYPTAEAAKAALILVAEDHGKVASPDGWRVDLTPEGCSESHAYVTRR